MPIEFLGKAYSLDLSFSIGDVVSVAAIALTAWIAYQTHQLQKKMTDLEGHPKRLEIYNSFKRVGCFLVLGSDFDSPKVTDYKILRDAKGIEAAFDSEIARQSLSLLKLKKKYDKNIHIVQDSYGAGHEEMEGPIRKKIQADAKNL